MNIVMLRSGGRLGVGEIEEEEVLKRLSTELGEGYEVLF
jgi:hypothetical protein